MVRKQTTYDKNFDELELDTVLGVAISSLNPKNLWQLCGGTLKQRGNLNKVSG